MPKPQTRDGYNDQDTRNCERVLVSLLSGLGPWRESVFLIGGLTPRYIVPQGEDTPAHAGTNDVDIVIDQAILADTEAYATLEENLARLGFERAENERGVKVSWRWKTRIDDATLVLEFLTDAKDPTAPRVQPLPATGNVSALNIPHSSMVFDLHEKRSISAEKIGDGGITTQTVRYADIVSFTCLKAFAFADRAENKDAHDLVYCLEHHPDGTDAVAQRFRNARDDPRHGPAVREALAHLRRCFCTDGAIEGHTKDGPVAAAKFVDEGLGRDRRILRQREASDVVERLLAAIG